MHNSSWLHILYRITASTALLSIAGCASDPSTQLKHQSDFSQLDNSLLVTGSSGDVVSGRVLEEFDSPWAMTYLPDGRAVVTEKGGVLWLLNADGSKAGRIENPPIVSAKGQGGLGDIVLHPEFASNGPGKGVVYISYVEIDSDNRSLKGAAVSRAVLSTSESGGNLTAQQVIWRQHPKVTGDGHFSHRLAFGPDGYLYITSGERQKFSPAQNMDSNLGKIVRVNEDGIAPETNPYYGTGSVTDQIWTLGHRNVLGIDFDADGQLWAHEMGPKGGDELNRIVRSENYGYPLVSNGEHYSGEKIPSHDSNPAYENPALWWDPVISPSGFVIYDGGLFTNWTGNGLIGGLSSQALVRVSFNERQADNLGAPPSDDALEMVAKEESRYSWGKRIREVEQGPNGAVLVLEDGKGGRLIELTPQP